MKDRLVIAVVDDDVSVRRALGRLLRAAQMDVLLYESGEEFLESGLRHNPDCLVLDVQMPGMTGVELCHQLKTSSSPVPIVIITAHDDEDIQEKAVLAGAEAYLLKPFSDEELLAAIRSALEESPNHTT